MDLPKSLAKPLAPSKMRVPIILRLRPGSRWRRHRRLPPTPTLSGSFEQDYTFPEERGFGYWLKSGFAFPFKLSA